MKPDFIEVYRPKAANPCTVTWKNGRLDGLLQSLGADREKVNALLSDREGLSQLLQSPQVRMLLQQLLAGQASPEP